MADSRVDKLARVLVQYSLAIKPKDIFRINSTALAAPLVRALVRETLLAGGFPVVRLALEDMAPILFKYASDEQLAFVPDFTRQETEQINATLAIISSENTRALSGVDPQRVAIQRKANRPLQERVLERAAAGDLRWCVALYPTQASAQDAEMSLMDYEEFVYGACKLHHDDPVASWTALRKEQDRIIAMLSTKNVIRLVAPGTDLTYHVGGRSWVNCYGDANFPDGEVFTGPHEDKTEGYIRYTFPAVYSGREVEDVRLVFKEGRVVEATAAKGQELLHSLIDMDEGARRLGEVAFGTNYDITRFSRNTLFDEKIGGTVHLALGACYPETGAVNQSALHWDMVCDMREHSEVYADGQLIYKDGKFIF
ncbi:MAG: aminopeptidase [Roseiflexaceae bacterium]